MTAALVAARAGGSVRRHGFGVLGQVFAALVVLGITAAIVLAVLLPRLGGATPYTVLTGSMRPHLPPGTLVVVRPVDPAAVRVGTVITYQLHSGSPEVVTHRVVEVDHAPDGSPRWRTQGDANPVPDLDLVRPVQVKGRLWYAVPYLGRANLLLTRYQHRTVVLVLASALLGYAGWMLLGAFRGRVAR